MREFSLRATLTGLVLGLLFALGNAYLGLKAGVTISASIPAAVIALGVLRKGSILEHNIVQTISSSSDAIATGVVFTIPALILLGSMPGWDRILLIALLGGLLGILLMVPLRHPLVVEEADRLPYPEGTACATLLKAKHRTEEGLIIAIWAALIAEGYKVLSGLLHLWKEVVSVKIFKGVAFGIDTTPSLLGIGLVIGARTSLMLLAGGVVAWWVLIPLLTFQSGPESPAAIWSSSIRYVGIGALAFGGLAHLVRMAPGLGRAFRGQWKRVTSDFFSRHAKELSPIWVIVGIAIVITCLFFLPQFHFSPLMLALVLVLSLLFVALTAATVGLLGISANPIPGVMVSVLLVIGLTFLGMGWVSKAYLITAMVLGSIVGIAIAVAGETSQDLKTGALIGAKPKMQQLGMLLGILLPSVLMAFTLPLFNETLGIGTEELPAPQATLMALVLDGVIEGTLPLPLVLVGGVIGLVVELLGADSLPFALGMYLPLPTSIAIGAGGVCSWLARRVKERALLVGAGLIAGDAVTGVLVAILSIVGWVDKSAPAYLGIWASLAAYALVLTSSAYLTFRRRRV